VFTWHVALWALMRCRDGLLELHAYGHALKELKFRVRFRASNQGFYNCKRMQMILLTRPKAIT
jgi:hypothetical protein